MDWEVLAGDEDGREDDGDDGAAAVLAAESQGGVEALCGTGWYEGEGWRVWEAALVETGWAVLSKHEERETVADH
jgi:hypothetical protein